MVRMAGRDKPIKLPDDFEQTLKDLLATGPTPKESDDDADNGSNGK